MGETKALERLLRRVGRDAAMYERMCGDMSARGAYGVGYERAAGEANVLRVVQDYIREELRKARDADGR